MRKLLSIILSLSFAGNALAAFPEDWGRRAKIVIHAASIDADLTNWTMILTEAVLPSEMLDADGSYPALNGGGDIRISTNTDGSGRCAIDVRTFTTNNNPALGVADIAVKIPSVLTTGATFYVWWSSAGATQPAVSDTYGQYNAYDANYIGVWPLNEDPSGTAPQMTERTSVAAHGTSNGSMTSGDSVTGAAGKALEFDGSDDFINVGSHTSSRRTSMSVSAWIVPNNDTNYRRILSREHHFLFGSYNRQLLFATGNGSTGWTSLTTYGTGAALTNGTAYHVASVHNGTSHTGYRNGSSVGSITSAMASTTAELGIGYAPGSAGTTQRWNGKIDEVRISSTARSAAWIKAEYVNLMTPTTFATAGTPETPGGATPSTFQQRRVIISE
jgi:trimeric autotransporter adhesin